MQNRSGNYRIEYRRMIIIWWNKYQTDISEHIKLKSRTDTLSNEIEVKLMAEPLPGSEAVDAEMIKRHISAVLNAKGAFILKSSEKTLNNSYYDTENQDLYRSGIALRVRVTNSYVEATVKTRRQSTGGIHIHPEYNVDLTAKPDVPRLDLFPEEIFSGLDRDFLQSHIYENMAQSCIRQIWLVQYRGGEVEISYDRVTYKTAAGCDVSSQEIELELKEGTTEILKELTEKLIDGIYEENLLSLRLESLSKMHRAAVYAGISSLEVPKTCELMPVPVIDEKMMLDAGAMENTLKNIRHNLSLMGRALSIFYLGEYGRTDKTALDAYCFIREAARQMADVPLNLLAVLENRSGLCMATVGLLQSIAGEYTYSGMSRSHDNDGNTLDEKESVMAAEATLTHMFTSKELLRRLLEFNFNGLKDEKL
ncbi:MAG: CYTH domain-containing protein [Ruminobacter sp.]|nr:CYTH domain-containing protein [Ruminobacter sp.]